MNIYSEQKDEWGLYFIFLREFAIGPFYDRPLAEQYTRDHLVTEGIRDAKILDMGELAKGYEPFTIYSPVQFLGFNLQSPEQYEQFGARSEYISPIGDMITVEMRILLRSVPIHASVWREIQEGMQRRFYEIIRSFERFMSARIEEETEEVERGER
jgi:hypothetical protein